MLRAAQQGSRNLGAGGCEFLLVFDDGAFSENATFSLCDRLAHTPGDVLAKNFGVSGEALRRPPDGERYILPGTVPPATARQAETTLRFLELFGSDRFTDISLRRWMATVPRELLREHIGPAPALTGALTDASRPVVDGPAGRTEGPCP